MRVKEEGIEKKNVGKINQTSKKRNVMSLMGAVIFWMEFAVLFHATFFHSFVVFDFLPFVYFMSYCRRNIVMLCSYEETAKHRKKKIRKTE